MIETTTRNWRVVHPRIPLRTVHFLRRSVG